MRRKLPGSLLPVAALLLSWALPTPAQAQTSFKSRRDYPVGADPRSVALGDFNEDGLLDLAVAGAGSNDVSVLLNNGDETFRAALTFGAGSGPRSVAASDLNGDGILDLVTANAGSGDVSILLGFGDGSFAQPLAFPAGSAPQAVAVGDFNGDGHPDLAVANTGSNDVSILLGNGDGTFQGPLTFAAGSHPQSVALGDFNGDGRTDLAVANPDAGVVSVLLGLGDGTLQGPVAYAVGSNPESVVVCNLNRDGRADLVVANAGSADVSVLFGAGDGTFQTASSAPAGAGPRSVAMGDFDADFIDDVAVANHDANTFSVLLTFSDGSLRTSQHFAVGAGPSFVALGDFNGDGLVDVAVANSSDNSVSVLINDSPRAYVSLTVSKAGAGGGTVTSSPSGIDCGNTCSAGFQAGSVVTLTASADSGSTFTGWSGGGCSGTGDCTVTIRGDAITVTATFYRPPRFTLTVSKAGMGLGTVTSSPAGIDCGLSCSATYDVGTPVTLSAQPGPFSVFMGWSGGGCSGTGLCNVTLTGDTTWGPRPPRVRPRKKAQRAAVLSSSAAGWISRSSARTVAFHPRGPGKGARRAWGRAPRSTSLKDPSGRGTITGRSTAWSMVRSLAESPRASENDGLSWRPRSCRTALPLSTGPVRWWKRPPRVTRSPRRSAARATAIWASTAAPGSTPSITNGSSNSRAAARLAAAGGMPARSATSSILRSEKPTSRHPVSAEMSRSAATSAGCGVPTGITSGPPPRTLRGTRQPRALAGTTIPPPFSKTNGALRPSSRWSGSTSARVLPVQRMREAPARRSSWRAGAAALWQKVSSSRRVASRSVKMTRDALTAWPPARSPPPPRPPGSRPAAPPPAGAAPRRTRRPGPAPSSAPGARPAGRSGTPRSKPAPRR